ncbi:hypothetical protein RFI_00023 [Reticulomyxa filosa]|uniref:Uncharacterized protein n=1 Tax=Reticulomyxa filosa TaxID=46433 RepID=X6PG05_RETFI|nr:hypothetical protein RFI_00023 [Reticulomyxa filosa]|eukprot:ETO37038.1 hypothetical protein RFI_00023 [Reticulomyxa filosa]
MWTAASVAYTLKHQAGYYGFEFDNLRLDWKGLVQRRNEHVEYLNRAYEKNLSDSKVTHVFSHAKFVAPKVVQSVKDSRKFTADHILIAVGGFPYIPDIPNIRETRYPLNCVLLYFILFCLNCKGKEYIYTSDDFFNKLDHLPKKTAIVGAGYIAVELAQVLAEMGSDVTMFIRGAHPLRKFDRLIQCGVHEALLHSGVKMIVDAEITAIENNDNSLSLKSHHKQEFTGFNCVIYAIGRGPLTTELGLNHTSVKQDKRGFIISNEWEETDEKGIYALGDVNDKIALTPVAIRAGRKWADRIFGGVKNANMDYHLVPSVIFSHPPIGTIGHTEEHARELVKANKLPEPVKGSSKKKIKIFESHFRGLKYGVYTNPQDKIMAHMKLVCVGKEERVVGLHMIGDGCDEMLQGFSVAIKMGATKEDFNNVTAIHPTAAEEVVNMKIPRGDEDNYQYNCGTTDKMTTQKH